MAQGQQRRGPQEEQASAQHTWYIGVVKDPLQFQGFAKGDLVFVRAAKQAGTWVVFDGIQRYQVMTIAEGQKMVEVRQIDGELLYLANPALLERKLLDLYRATQKPQESPQK